VVFASLIFLYLFFPLNILLYFFCPKIKWRNLILVLFSLFFYAWGEPVWVFLLIFSASMDYLLGHIIGSRPGSVQAKIAVGASVTINLGLLALFKYSGFLVENLNVLLQAVLNVQLPVPAFTLPIGISFYTFQTLTYTIDVYRGKLAPQKSYIGYLMYLSLYPQLIAGPIVRYEDVAAQINRRRTNAQNVAQGLMRFCVGLGKKVLLANTAGALATQYLGGDLSTLPVAAAWFGIIMYTVQIYMDFSGYSDMAIGLGRIFGFHYPENFLHPYISRSATEFWRRWHISLGSFFRDYVYIPLGGNRHHQLRNIFIVWFLTGFWHGASWNFILWGLFYGALIVLEKQFFKDVLERLPRVVSFVYMFFVTIIGWTLFYFTDLRQVFSFLGILFGVSGHAWSSTVFGIDFMGNILFFALSILCCMPLLSGCKTLLEKHHISIDSTPVAVFRFAGCFLLLAASTVMLVSDSYNPFLYFRF